MVRYQKGEGAVYVALVPLKNRILVCKIPLAGTRFLYGSVRFGVIILELWPTPSSEGGSGWSTWQCGPLCDHCNLCEQVNGKTSVWHAALLICGHVDAESFPFDLSPQNCQLGSHTHIAADFVLIRLYNASNCGTTQPTAWISDVLWVRMDGWVGIFCFCVQLNSLQPVIRGKCKEMSFLCFSVNWAS